MLYWVDSGEGEILRAPIDAQDPAEIEVIATGLTSPQGIDVDPVGGHVYWADIGTQSLMRCALDGSDIEVLLQGAAFVKGVAFDRETRSLYWCDPVLNWIQRLDLETLQASLVVQGLDRPQDVLVFGDELYWVQGNDGIFRRQIEKGSSELITPGFDGQATVLCGSPVAGRLFWIAAGRINALSSDGACGMISSVIVGAAQGIDTIPGTDDLVWSDDGQLFRAEASGEGLEQIMPFVDDAERIAVGPRLAPPSVRSPLISVVVPVNGLLEIRADVEGSGPFSYQWEFSDGIGGDDLILEGQTTPTLLIEQVRLDDAGAYRCIVSGPGGVLLTDRAIAAVRLDPADRFPADAADILRLLEWLDCNGC